MSNTLQFPTPLPAPRRVRMGAPPRPFQVLLGRVGTRRYHVPMSLIYHAGQFYARIEGGRRIGIRTECVVARYTATDKREWPRPAFDRAITWLAARGVAPLSDGATPHISDRAERTSETP